VTRYLTPPPDTAFRTSSYSNDEKACVEIAVAADGGRWLRDTKDRTRPAHYFTPVEWDAFIRGVKAAEFD
jgi:hypothetical protein